MPAEQPFEANLGGTVSVVAVSTSAPAAVSIVTGSELANSIYVASNSSVMLFVRLDPGNVTTASSIDIPIPPNSARIFANPQPIGTTFCSVSGAVFGSGSGTVFFTPGQGGGA